MRRICFVFISLMLSVPAWAQSQAANGAIEGTIIDSSGGVLPGVTITVTNTETGVERSVVTNEKGLYRVPLLSLGTYRVVVELPGFKRFERTDIRVSVGEAAVVNATLDVGAVSETITVNSNDITSLESSRIDIGHTMSDVEVHNLPLVARNPYNFALVQPGVTGYENVEFGVPHLAANGASMRINYQVDGNTNTEKDRAGLRLLPMSEVMIQEVKVVTTGFAPEFGQTMGMVYNAITPSGTNAFRGEGGYLFRRKPFSAFPFFFGCSNTTIAANCPPTTAPESQKPDTRTDSGTADLGGPIVKNKLFFYGGWEQTRRDLSSTALITVDPTLVAAVGVKPQPAEAPNVQTAKFAIGKSDYQIDPGNRLTVRWMRFHNDAPYNSGAGTATLETQTNFLDAMDSTAGQFVSSIGPDKLNELRVQYAHRHQSSSANSDSGPGPAIKITNPASAISFGGPLLGTGQGSAGFDFKQNITELVDNFTYIRAAHSYKFGFDWQHIYDTRTNAPEFLYTFPTLASYLAAKSGVSPYGYSSLAQLTGNRTFAMNTNVFSGFVQDDWQIVPSVKILYGVRYDLYHPPSGLADAPLTTSHQFNVDKKDFGPRAGVAWSIDSDTVLRGSTGLMYDQPILGGYEQAIALSAAPSMASPFNYNGAAAPAGATPGAPAFPSGVTAGPTVLPNSLWTVDPNFVLGRTWQANLQLEHGFAHNVTAFAGVMYAKGSDLPVVTSINPINPIGSLADGRPIYGSAVTPATRLDPRFNYIQEVQSIGSSTFKSLTLGTTKRFAKGTEFNIQYTLGKGLDNTPIPTQLTVQSEPGRSDPTFLDRDRGPNPLDVRHSVNGNIVYISENHSPNAVVRQLLNGNEFGVLIQINSGLPVNILASRELNGDGVTSDRPLFVGRNSLYLPWRKNVDLRYTRWIPLQGSVRGEIVAEIKNVFNTVELSGINTTVAVDPLGNPLAPIPTDPYQFPGASGYEQRKFQLGFKVRF